MLFERSINIKKILILIIIMGLYNNIALFLSFKNAFIDNSNIELKAEIIRVSSDSEKSTKYIIKVTQNINSEKIFKIINKKFIIYTKTNEYKPGDIVYIKGTVSKADGQRNLKGFNYKRYLKINKIYGIINVEKINYIKTKKDVIYIIGSFQNKLKNQIEKIYNEKYQEIIGKMLFGFDSNIEENTNDNFKAASLSHVLAISGMHISYIVLFMNLILSCCVKNIKLRNIIIIIFLCFFIIFTNFSASCMRACIMNILVLISKNIYRKSNVYINVLASFVFLNWINIYTIFDIGMWLSFAGTLGILIFYKFFRMFITLKKFKILYQIQNIIMISFSAQILIFPIILYSFNTVSLTFFLSNVLISPIIGPLIIIGYISIFLSIILYPFGILLAKIENFLCFLLCKIAEIISKLQLSKIYISGDNIFFLFFYYVIIVFGIYCFNRYKWKILRNIVVLKLYLKDFLKLKKNEKRIHYKYKNKFLYKSRNNYSVFRLKKIKIIAILIVFINLIYLLLFFSQNSMELYFVDVGQGDCTIIKTRKNNIIIDGGEGISEKYDYGKNVILQHLLKLGINRIDYMIFSHFDSDHAGGLIYILKNLEVKKIIIGIQLENSECLEDVIRIAKEKNIEIVLVKAGDRIDIENKCFIEIFWPNNNKLIEENALNNNSLVFKFNYKEFNTLFTGDIEEVAEKEIVKLYENTNLLKSKILKISHHGSKTSTTEEFLNAVSPRIALIGVGKDNNFGHPSINIIERLNLKKIKIYRTDQDGEIIIKIKERQYKNSINVHTTLR